MKTLVYKPIERGKKKFNLRHPPSCPITWSCIWCVVMYSGLVRFPTLCGPLVPNKWGVSDDEDHAIPLPTAFITSPEKTSSLQKQIHSFHRHMPVVDVWFYHSFTTQPCYTNCSCLAAFLTNSVRLVFCFVSLSWFLFFFLCLAAGMESDQVDIWIRLRALWEGEGWGHHQDGPRVWSGDHCQKLTHPLQPG